VADTKKDNRSLSVIFPAFNEEANIVASVERARAVLAPLCADYEVVVVDDGSSDGTAAVANELARRYAEVRVIHHDRNYKLGRTLRTGFEAATKDLVFYTDADLPIDFADIPRGVALLEREGADGVVGYRLDRGEPWFRLIYSFVYNRLVNLLFGINVRDVNFSFKLFTRATLSKFRLTSEGSFIDAELLARARAAGARVVQMGVHYYPRQAGTSTLARPGIIFKILAEMVRFRVREWRPRRAAAPAAAPERL